MTATTQIAISIQKTLFDQIESVTQQFKISGDHLIEIAIENFLKNYQGQALLDEINKSCEDRLTPEEEASGPYQETVTASKTGRERMVASQGNIYWVPLEEESGSEPGYTHPHVVIQDNVLNRSRINTVVVCALTSNVKRAKAPGNVLLEEGEANLSKQSVVVVSQVSTVDKTQLGEYIGSLTEQRINQILAGMQFLQVMAEHHETS